MTWSSMESIIDIRGTKRAFARRECEDALQAIGVTHCPPSYVELMKRFGCGTFFDDLFIAVPYHPLETATIKYTMTTSKKAWRDMQVEFPEFVRSPDILKRAICIGGFSNGFDLCWDPAKTDADGEMMLGIVTHADLEVKYCGQTLLEFLGEFCINGKLKLLFDPAIVSFGNQPTFEATSYQF